MTNEEFVEYMKQSIQSHDQQLGELVERQQATERQIDKVTEQQRATDSQVRQMLQGIELLSQGITLLTANMQDLVTITRSHGQRITKLEGQQS